MLLGYLVIIIFVGQCAPYSIKYNVPEVDTYQTNVNHDDDGVNEPIEEDSWHLNGVKDPHQRANDSNAFIIKTVTIVLVWIGVFSLNYKIMDAIYYIYDQYRNY